MPRSPARHTMANAPPARRSRGTDAPKDGTKLRLPIWPGLALAGGVVIAAVVVLLVLSGSGGGPREGRLPTGANPGDTRLFPNDPVVVEERTPKPPKRRLRGAETVPGSSAAGFQYDGDGNRGFVLGGP